jgi:hypothetical protein
MKIKACHFGIAGAVTFSTAYAVLALAIKIFPNPMLKFIGTIHMMPKLEYIKPFISVTPQAVALGMLTHTITAFILCWLTATIYNLFQRND